MFDIPDRGAYFKLPLTHLHSLLYTPGKISLDDLRGSGSLKQLPDTILALERNQQAEEEKERQLIRLRLLKNRFVGDTGIAGYLAFEKGTEQYSEVTKIKDYMGEEEKGNESNKAYGF